jgi:hypothetical protein
MREKVDGWFGKIGQKMNHIIHVVDARLHIEGGRTTNLTSNGACKRN